MVSAKCCLDSGPPAGWITTQRHVFEAQKYGLYFITTDERILSRADSLHDLCRVIVLRPSEFLALLKQHTADA